MLVVHIGLGKTATSSLQAYVLPKLAEMKNITAPPSEFNQIAARHLTFDEADEKTFHAMAESDAKYLISYEALVDWNPRNWEAAADRNLRLFGPKAEIVLTLREPQSYLTSLYQQVIQMGNIIPETAFFVSKSDYDATSPWLNAKSLERFDVDAFDLEHLVGLYQTRFETVHVETLPNLASMRLWQAIYDLDDAQTADLVDRFQNSPRANQSYSKLAMRLTFARERLLDMFHLRSQGSEDTIPQLAANRPIAPRSKLASLGRKLFNHHAWMERVVNRFLPNTRFELGRDVYLNPDLMQKNREFISRF